MKKYLGILLSVFFALIIRIVAEFDIIEINSWAFLLITPAIISFIPLFIDKETFAKSICKSIVYPILGIIIFFLIAFAFNLEDLGCLLILLPPYLFFSVIVSIIIHDTFKHFDSDDKLNKNSFLLLLLPIIVGVFEKNIDKSTQHFSISETVIINQPHKEIWRNLFVVPNLENSIKNSTFNYFGFPNPIYSTYNSTQNLRKGYFSNGVVLHEHVEVVKPFEELRFTIDLENSEFQKNQTFKHVLKSKSLEFDAIVYELKPITEDKTELILKCDYVINSNIPFYGEFWSKIVINDFEFKLLNALKTELE